MTQKFPRFLLAFPTLLAAAACSGSSDSTGSPGSAGTAGTAGTGAAPSSGGTSGSGTGGTGTAGTTPLDDPFGVGPRFCDQNSGVGGDSCVGFAASAGFFTDPEHLTTNNAGSQPITVAILTEYTPSTALKEAAERGIELRAHGSENEFRAGSEWSVNAETGAVALLLLPEEELTVGWYSIVIARSVREAMGAQYRRFTEPPLFRGGPFVETESGDLRADFRVGSDPRVARVRARQDGVTITFSEELSADSPPVALSIGNYRPACEPSEWSGTGRALELACSEPLSGYGDPVGVSFTEGFVTAEGLPLQGPNGDTTFVIEVPEDSLVELAAPVE